MVRPNANRYTTVPNHAGRHRVAINELDSRYFDLHGKTVQLPLMDRTIPIVVDDLAIPVRHRRGKVTPAHDPNDFECGAPQSPKIEVIDETAHMTEAAGPHAVSTASRRANGGGDLKNWV
jgi:valyl-tRNA synthetase